MNWDSKCRFAVTSHSINITLDISKHILMHIETRILMLSLSIIIGLTGCTGPQTSQESPDGGALTYQDTSLDFGTLGESIPDDSEDETNVQAHAFKVVRVNNQLKFAILQNVTGLTPPPGETLVVYRGDEYIGKLAGGGQADETFLSADILEGDLMEGDLAFLILKENKESTDSPQTQN